MTNYEKLKKLIEETDELIKKGITNDDPEFDAWEMRVKRFLVKMFGSQSMETQKFESTPFWIGDYTFDTPAAEIHKKNINACRRGLETTKLILETYLDDLVNEKETAPHTEHQPPKDMSKVFIVHGHDGELKEAVARAIEKQNIEAIILSEHANTGRTIIEKFEQNSDVGCAIFLFTADDIGKAKDEKEEKARARQNVVFEAGYFMGKLGREHTVLIAESEIEMPSDLKGVVYTNKSNWLLELHQELNAMGYIIDLNKLLK